MFIDNKGANGGLRSLTWYCQRVAINHLDSICSVEGLPFPLIKCILESCSADTLLRLEQASPTVQSETHEVWMRMCRNTYKQFWSDYELGRLEEPKSWKATFFDLRVQEAEKFRQLGAKLRSQRVEHEERRKEKEVRYSGLLPPPKRQRMQTWGQSSAPKTLFEKARSRTAQITKGVYAATRILPPMPQYKNYATMLPPRTVSAKPPPPASRPSVIDTPALPKVQAPDFSLQTPLETSTPSPPSSSSSSNRSSSSAITPTSSSTPSTSPTPSTPTTVPSPIPKSGIITVTRVMVPKPVPRSNPPLDPTPKRQRYMDPVLPHLARRYARQEAVARERGIDKPSTSSTMTQTLDSGGTTSTPKPPPLRKPDAVLFMPRHRASSQLPSRSAAS